MTKIILDETTAKNMYAEWLDWQKVAKERWQYEGNWKRSPIARENRRESIVYGNCAGYLDWILRNAQDENGNDWWTILHHSENKGAKND